MNPQNPPNPSALPGDSAPGGRAPQSGGTLTDTKNKIAQTAREAAGKVKTATANTAAKAKDEAGRILSEKKEAAANRVGGYSSALHESAQSFEQRDPNIAWFTHQAADKLQGVADYMRSSNFASVRNDCESFARRHPAMFFGGLFFAGLMLGNALKASRSKIGSNDQDRLGYDGQSKGGNSEFENSFDQQPQMTAAERTSAGL